MNDALNHFRAGVIAERQFADTVTRNELFDREQWHARVEYLADRIGSTDFPWESSIAEQYGRLSVAFSILEALDSDRKA